MAPASFVQKDCRKDMMINVFDAPPDDKRIGGMGLRLRVRLYF